MICVYIYYIICIYIQESSIILRQFNRTCFTLPASAPELDGSEARGVSESRRFSGLAGGIWPKRGHGGMGDIADVTIVDRSRNQRHKLFGISWHINQWMAFVKGVNSTGLPWFPTTKRSGRQSYDLINIQNHRHELRTIGQSWLLAYTMLQSINILPN